jgi:hypothetical protein
MVYSVLSGQRLETAFLGGNQVVQECGNLPIPGHVSCVTTCAHPSGEGALLPPRKALKEGFEFGEMARRTHENVLAEMLEKALAYNITQIIRVRKKLSEAEQMERAAA